MRTVATRAVDPHRRRRRRHHRRLTPSHTPTAARPRTTTSTTAVATLGSTLAKTTTTAGPAAVSPSSAAHGSLPFTGSHTNLIGWIGVAVTLAGLVLVQGGRRRPHRGTGA